MYCVVLSASFVLLFGQGISAGSQDHKSLKEHIGMFVKNAEWKPLSWKAEIDGSMILSVVQKYKVPLKTNFSENGEFLPGNFTPRSCLDIRNSNHKDSDGVYTIYPGNLYPKKAYCDMTTDGGGWTVFQRRFNGTVVFDRYWFDYKAGFGDPKGEYWLGNEAVHHITTDGFCTLRIDLLTTKKQAGYEKFYNFTIGSENEGYAINFADERVGTAGGYALAYHKGMKFSTRDHDNDLYSGNCAAYVRGAWWHKNCQKSNLNGRYLRSSLQWSQWEKISSTVHIKETKMMVRC